MSVSSMTSMRTFLRPSISPRANGRVLDQTLVRSACGDRISQPIAAPAQLSRISSPGFASRFKIGATTAPVDIASIETAIKYAGYLRRQESRIEGARGRMSDDGFEGFAFERVPGLSRRSFSSYLIAGTLSRAPHSA